MRLHNYASAWTSNFTDPQNHTTIISGIEDRINVWSLSNLALSMDGGITVLDGYTVYQKYGSPMAWQFPQWQGWLACRIRAPGLPIWRNPSDYNNPNNVSIQSPMGTFEWGSPFVQTGYLPPYGCLGSPCSPSGANCQNPSPGYCGSIGSDIQGGNPPCPASGNCVNGGTGPNGSSYDGSLQKHFKLPYIYPLTGDGDYFCSQTPDNNPFMAFGIPCSSPIILRFLGYGYDTPDQTKVPDGTGGSTTYTGGPASDQYVQIEQFITLVNNGGFYGYAETNSNMSQSQLENYLFGYYTFESKYAAGKPPPNTNTGCSTAATVGSVVQGGLGGVGIGMMACLGPEVGIGSLVAAAAATSIGAAGGYLSAKGQCNGGQGACNIM